MIYTIIFGVLLGSCAVQSAMRESWTFDCVQTPYGCIPLSQLTARQESDLLASCEGYKDELASLGHTDIDCEAIVSELGSEKYQQLMTSIKNGEDIFDAMATCMEFESELADSGYALDCETLIQGLEPANIVKTITNSMIQGAKNKGGPKDMIKPTTRCLLPFGWGCIIWKVANDCYNSDYICKGK